VTTALPDTTMITRARHPLEGRELRVLGGMRRHGRLELLLVLPDGSKSLVPVAWTSAAAGEAGPALAGAATVGATSDLLAVCALVAAFSARNRDDREQAARTHLPGRMIVQPVQLSLLPEEVPAPPVTLIAQLPQTHLATALVLLAGLIARAAARETAMAAAEVSGGE